MSDLRDSGNPPLTEQAVCPTCGLAVAFSEADDGVQPTRNPLRSPGCWTVTARLTKQGQKPLRRDGRADLRQT